LTARRMTMSLVVVKAGRLDYEKGVTLQERLVERVWASPEQEYLVTCEHPAVITMGRSASAQHVLAGREELSRRGVQVHEVSRGGDVTYHGPGQLVVYPVVNLSRRKLGVREYLRRLEEVVIRTLARFGIESGRDPEYTGVWVGPAKVCAIGVAVKRWVTWHGLALNVTTTLGDFRMIQPCGIVGRDVTSMERLLKARGEKTPPMDEVAQALVEAFAEVFDVAEMSETNDVAGLIAGRGKFPPWMRKQLPAAGHAGNVRALLEELKLETVCGNAVCPNQCECFARGTATFMILGRVCTRNCRFCAVASGKPGPVDAEEPGRVAEAAKRLGLKHVVVTSVTRDDLPDGGAGHFAATIGALRQVLAEGATIEVLTPDFGGDAEALKQVLNAGPDVFNHNMETVVRLYPVIRPGAGYTRSLEVLRAARSIRPGVVTKSGLMVGLGETREELREALADLRQAGVELLTLGQYLAPSAAHHPVIRFVSPEEFEEMEREALEMGFGGAACGPFVRSSYRAGHLLEALRSAGGRDQT